MSAALVESVREAVKLRALLFANSDVIGMGHEYYRLDLPAILAALTEAEALRAQVAAGQAREVALREGLAFIATNECECEDHTPFACPSCSAKGALSAPTDTAALRAMLEKVWMLGYDAPDATDGNAETQRTTDIDRVLGGS